MINFEVVGEAVFERLRLFKRLVNGAGASACIDRKRLFSAVPALLAVALALLLPSPAHAWRLDPPICPRTARPQYWVLADFAASGRF